MKKLLSTLLVLVAVLSVKAYDIHYVATFHNQGSTGWWGTVHGTNFLYVNSSSTLGQDFTFNYGSSGAQLAPGGTDTVTYDYPWPANTGGSESTLYIANGGPTNMTAGTTGGGGVIGQTMTVTEDFYVNTTPQPACTTNVVIELNDAWTNGITVTIVNVQLGTQTLDVAGPLVAYPYTVGTVYCTNTATTGSYSNHPPCMTPLVFDIKNTSSNWRIYAVGYTTAWLNSSGRDQILQNSSMVSPNGTYYYSNNVPCNDGHDYSLYASPAGGGDQVADTGITNMVGKPPNTDQGGGEPRRATAGVMQTARLRHSGRR